LGLDHVAQCHAVVLLERTGDPDELKAMAAEIENPSDIEEVVEGLLTQVHGVPKKRDVVPSFDTDDIT
jgi:2-C-methyl-D-erythritol 2,4-cyclodiphosphate synthase